MKTGISLVFLYLFSLVSLLTPSFADDPTDAYDDCQQAANRRFNRCDDMMNEFLESGDEKLFNKSKKCMEDNDAVQDQCRQSRKLISVKNKAWRKNNANALSGFGKALEAADDKCVQAAESGRDKCGTIKSDKKRAKCSISVEKKKNRCMQKALKSYKKRYKKLKPPSEALEGGGLQKVEECHKPLKSNLRSCKTQKCVNKYHSAFQRCVKRETKGVVFKKGSSAKKLADSIQKVKDAGTPLYRKCSDKAAAYEKKKVAKAKKRGTLQAEADGIKEKAEKLKQACYETWAKQHNKAMETQIRLHLK
ncbi:MAG: hypothetical protein GY705_27930 [Bacteroidetes bacterium]|nr:hypothetical protein [Bacteroidota bacterium]